MAQIRAVVSVVGQDQKGVVARFATFLAERGVNIEDLSQHVVRGLFMMDMLVDLTDMTLSLDELVNGLQETGKQIEMDVRVSLSTQRRDKRVAVLVSKEPHCLEKLIEDQREGLFRGSIDCVLGNHETLRPVAEAAGIEFDWKSSTDKPAHMQWLADTMVKRKIDLVVLARYMQILTPTVVEPFRHRIINIHPSLLPHFPGSAPYRQAYEQGVRVSGCTAHFVTEDLDEGPIILQDVFHIEVGADTPEDVRDKGLELEANVLSKAVQFFCNEQLVVVEDRVVFKPGLSTLLDEHDAS
ncbi:formyltetrahydrofolate deformylase [Planctomycetales bacterium ZRK34]|nr:formyltetrahydrofolate deformylase [Planctomycetales bacterium ZRK34]